MINKDVPIFEWDILDIEKEWELFTKLATEWQNETIKFDFPTNIVDTPTE